LHPSYVRVLSSYNKVVKQKNSILQESLEQQLNPDVTETLLAPWNQQLVELAAQIHQARTQYIQSLNDVLERHLFDRREISIQYISALDGKGDLSDYEALLAERLHLRLGAEIAAGRALLGPHRDDLAILSGGREMRVYGSAGQQRSALLLLDLAAISLYNSSYSDYPIFLIDDVDAELDGNRIKRLLEYLEGRTQTFITTSKRTHVQEFLSRASVYEIEAGKVVTRETGSAFGTFVCGG
jgi:DNA replication and repair protein RecF